MYDFLVSILVLSDLPANVEVTYSFLPALIGGLAGIAGTVLTNKANKDVASDQMDFQEDMSNSAYQRAMVDMEEAGLNPILAYKTGGASSPSGSSIAMQNPMAGIPNMMDTMANSAVSRKLIRNQMEGVLQTNRKTEKEGDLIDLKKDQQKIINNVLEHQSVAQINEAKRTAASTGTINEVALPVWKQIGNFIDKFPSIFRKNLNDALKAYELGD